jgi:hypothetical protein
MMKSVRSGRSLVVRWCFIGVGVAALAAATWWLLAQHTRGAEIAGVLALPVTAIATVTALATAWPRREPKEIDHERLVAAARNLARKVAREESRERELLLADTGDPRPADLTFAQPELISWRTDGGNRRGSMEKVAGFYAELDRGRLVVLGPPGSGKTVLAIQLIHDLVSALLSPDGASGIAMRVPVRLSASAFNPARDLFDAVTMSARLDAWVVRHLVDVYGTRPAVASRLVDDGWIIPVLDGLDEMDADDRPPALAAAIIRGLNHRGGMRPVVVTCRRGRYGQLAELQEVPGNPDVLQDATVIEIDPLTVDTVARYLTYRFPGSARPTRVQQRWEPVVEHIRRDRHGSLARVLRSPLRLFLAVTAYQARDTRPEELITMDPGDLERHLFDEFIPAAYRPHGGPHFHNRWSAQTAETWLVFLARHLEQTIGTPDLAWWQMQLAIPPAVSGLGSGLGAGLALGLASGIGAGPIVGLAAGLASMLAAGLALGIAAARWQRPEPSREVRRRFSIGSFAAVLAVGLATQLAIGLAFGLRSGLSHGLGRGFGAGLGPGLVGLVGGLTLGFAAVTSGRPEPSREVRWRFSIGSLAAGLGVGLAVGLAIGLPYGPRYGLFSGAAVGLASAVAVGLEGMPPDLTAAASPRMNLRGDRRAALAVALVVGVGVGFGIGLGFPLVYGLIIGVAYGFAFGLVVIMLRTAWPSYVLAVVWLALRHRLPWSLMDFLADAHRRGVLRQVGAAYQFRHMELRDHLAARADLRSINPQESQRRSLPASRPDD